MLAEQPADPGEAAGRGVAADAGVDHPRRHSIPAQVSVEERGIGLVLVEPQTGRQAVAEENDQRRGRRGWSGRRSPPGGGDGGRHGGLNGRGNRLLRRSGIRGGAPSQHGEGGGNKEQQSVSCELSPHRTYLSLVHLRKTGNPPANFPVNRPHG